MGFACFPLNSIQIQTASPILSWLAAVGAGPSLLHPGTSLMVSAGGKSLPLMLDVPYGMFAIPAPAICSYRKYWKAQA